MKARAIAVATGITLLTGMQPVAVADGRARTAPGGNGQLLFTSARLFNNNLYTMNPDGSFAGVLVDSRRSETTIAWSPDGTRVAFGRYHGGADLYTVNADGSGETRLTATTDSEELAPAFSPDGTRIAFVKDAPVVDAEPAELWIMNADGTNAAAAGLTDEPWSELDWSPDGTAIVYPAITNQSTAFETELRSFDLASSTVTTLSSLGDLVSSPSFSPDATRVAYVSHTGEDNELRVVDADGTDDALLYDGGSRLIGDVAWAPDGSSIAVAEYGVGPTISLIDAVSGVRSVVAAQHAYDLAWQPCAADCTIDSLRDVDMSFEAFFRDSGRLLTTVYLRPLIEGARATVFVLKRTQSGSLRRVGRAVVDLADGEDEVRLDTPRRGRCRLRVVYRGDDQHHGDVDTSRSFDCGAGTASD